jgi:hypothetical protein
MAQNLKLNRVMSYPIMHGQTIRIILDANRVEGSMRLPFAKGWLDCIAGLPMTARLTFLSTGFAVGVQKQTRKIILGVEHGPHTDR